MLLIFTKRRWGNYWQLLRQWVDHKIDELKAAVNSVAQSIDFTPVNNKLDTISGKIDNIDVKDAKEALVHELMQTANVYGTSYINCIAIDWLDAIKNYYIVGKVVIDDTTYYKWVTADALPLEYVYTTKWKNLTIYGGDAVYQLVDGEMVRSEKNTFSAHHVGGIDISPLAKEAAATANKETVMGGKLPVNTGHSIPAILWGDEIKDIDNEGELFMYSSVLTPEGFGVGSVVTAENMTDGEEDMYYVAKAVNNPSVSYDGQDYSISGATFMMVEKGKCYRCTSIVPLSYTEDDETITGELYVYEEYEPGRSGKEIYDKVDEVKEAVENIHVDSESADLLAAFFNITPPVPDAVPMTQQEVEDDLDELWNLIITQ